jgi:hypothetical protein
VNAPLETAPPSVVTFPAASGPETIQSTGRRWPWLLALAAGTALAIVGITGWPSTRPGTPAPAARDAEPPAPAGPPRTTAPPPAGTPVPAEAGSPLTPAAPLRITLTATRAVWMRVVADGRRQLEREVDPGETISFTASRGILLRTGDAGGVTLTVNGVDEGVLGGNYAVVTRTIEAPAVRPSR